MNENDKKLLKPYQDWIVKQESILIDIREKLFAMRTGFGVKALEVIYVDLIEIIGESPLREPIDEEVASGKTVNVRPYVSSEQVDEKIKHLQDRIECLREVIIGMGETMRRHGAVNQSPEIQAVLTALDDDKRKADAE